MTIVKGTRIKVVVEPHMAGQDTGEVVSVEERRTAYEILFDGDDEPHRWYLDGEVVESTKEPSSGARVAPATAGRDGKRVRPYILTHQPGADTIALPGDVLAIDPGAFGRAFLPTDARLEAEADRVPGMVAVVNICGPLFQRSFDSMFGSHDGYDTILARFVAALEHPQVGAVVLVINSPGGETAGLYEVVRRMTEARAAAGKPVFAYADEMIASAAYALATVADAGIYLPRSGEVGSVGVLMVHAEASAANEKDGLRFTIIRSGPRKFEGNAIEPLSDAARVALQERVDGLALQFFELVAAARGVTPEQVAALEGASFSGQQAVDKGLATGVASLEEVLTKAGQAVAGVPMTAEEKQKMDALEAENADMKAKLAAKHEEESEEDSEETEEEDTADGEGDSEKTEEEAPAKGKKATAEVARLTAELAKRDVRDQARELVDTAARAGKVAPADRKELVTLGEQAGLPALKLVLAALPYRAPKRAAAGSTGAAVGATPPGAKPMLTDVEKLVAKQAGITEEAFANSKAALAQKETV